MNSVSQTNGSAAMCSKASKFATQLVGVWALMSYTAELTG